jgi:hypothetical protein
LEEPKFNAVNSDVNNLNWVLLDDTPGVPSTIRRAGDALRGWLQGE